MRDQQTSPDGETRTNIGGGSFWRPSAGWLIGIVGGIGILLGAVILLAGEEQYIGLGGDLSWQIGSIEPVWAFALLIGGGALALAGAGLVIFGGRAPQAGTHDTGRRDLLVNATAFVLVNAFLWIQDIAIGGGLEYAYWVTIPWGIGLAIHAIVYYQGAHRHPPTAPQAH